MRLPDSKTALVTVLAVSILTGAGATLRGAGADGEQQFLTRIRRLTFEGRRAGEGYFSQDGTKLVFQSEREAGNPFYQIYELDLETGETVRISPGRGKTTCAFLRPGTNDVLFGTTGPRGGKREGLAESAARSAMRSIGSQVGREIIRGVLGGILGGGSRRR